MILALQNHKNESYLINQDYRIMEDFTKSTSKILSDCAGKLDYLNSYTHTDSSRTPQKNYNHPSIKYFQEVQDKNHFKYHKSKLSKSTVDTIRPKENSFDPYDRESLLGRIQTFNALNWKVPESTGITELLCAQNGWKCLSYAMSNKRNHLICSSCNLVLILKFNEVNECDDTLYLPFEFDSKEYDELNINIGEQYYKLISKFHHDNDCPWKEYEVPLQGIYYLRPYLSTTDEYLIGEYLKTLKSLIDNTEILNMHTKLFNEPSFIGDPDKFKHFIKTSQSLLGEHYYKDNKENLAFLLGTPMYVYYLAIFGWNLKVQLFSNKQTLLFNCRNCNARYFINLTEPESIDNLESKLNLSSSQILTPCKYPITLSTSKSHLYDPSDSESDNDSDFDLIEEHKDWCLFVHGMHKEEYLDYFVNVILQIEKSNEEHVGLHEMVIDSDEAHSKRKGSFDIIDGLERLRKLRKLYLLDE